MPEEIKTVPRGLDALSRIGASDLQQLGRVGAAECTFQWCIFNTDQ